MSNDIGFVGLGRMGNPMAGRLAGAGYRVLGFDVSQQARESWAQQVPGAIAVAGVTATGDGAEAVILMLPDSSVVTEVLIRRQLLASLRPGTVVVDMSSSEPQAGSYTPLTLPTKTEGQSLCVAALFEQRE